MVSENRKKRHSRKGRNTQNKKQRKTKPKRTDTQNPRPERRFGNITQSCGKGCEGAGKGRGKAEGRPTKRGVAFEWAERRGAQGSGPAKHGGAERVCTQNKGADSSSDIYLLLRMLLKATLAICPLTDFDSKVTLARREAEQEDRSGGPRERKSRRND